VWSSLLEFNRRLLGIDGLWVFAHKNRGSEKITLLLQQQGVKDPKDDMTVKHGIRDFGSFAETKTSSPPFRRALYSD